MSFLRNLFKSKEQRQREAEEEEDETFGDDFSEDDKEGDGETETFDHLFGPIELGGSEMSEGSDDETAYSESLTSSQLINGDEAEEIEDDEISEVSYDSVFEGGEPSTVYAKKFKAWLATAPPPHLVQKKKKKKKKDPFVAKREDEVLDQGDIVDKKYDWLYRKKKRLSKRKNKKETANQLLDRIAARAELENEENRKAEEEAALARRQASLAALGIKLGPDGKPIDDSDEKDKLPETNILHEKGTWHKQQYDARMNALFKSICKPELRA
jgi:hypothetical protein